MKKQFHHIFFCVLQSLPFIPFQDRINRSLHEHGHHMQAKHKTSNKTDAFFAEIPQEIIKKLYLFCKRDYDMLGYPKPKYIEQ